MTLSNHGEANKRGEPVRQRVLDAAERLLRIGKAEFSMRELAEEAEVSFATPFNQFGSKAGIMHALSARRIDTMVARYRKAATPPDITGRIRLAVETAVAVMLEEPTVNRAVMGWIGTPGSTHANAMRRSIGYWEMALTKADHAPSVCLEVEHLSRHLAVGFRGILSFWTAGEVSDVELGPWATELADALSPSSNKRLR